jgi:hypothetical protein
VATLDPAADPVATRPGFGDPGLEVAIDPTIAAVNASRRTAQRLCPRGSYCAGGVAVACPAGVWGAGPGRESPACDGPCTAGYYCPPGSVSPTQHMCGNETVFCPPGSAAPTVVTTGFYSVGGRTDAAGGRMRSAVPVTCDANFTVHGGGGPPAAARPELPSSVCVADHDGGLPGGVALAGSVAVAARADEAVDAPPPPGAAAVAGPGLLPPIVPPAPCGVPRSPLLAPSNFTFTRWRYCYGGPLGDVDTRTAQARCEPGAFCWFGTRMACPPGRFGAAHGETEFSCTGECPAGYYCPWGSANGTARPCGGPGVYCPAGSGAPTPVDIGHYSDPSDPADRRVRQVLCEPGSYCVGAVKYPCPAGTFGGIFGLSSAECSGPCAAGHFCPEGSTLPTQVRCGIHRGTAVYCPPGSSKPLTASPGSYTTGGFDRVVGLPSNTTRAAVVRCEAGHFCADGIRRQCPGGTYGGRAALETPACDGPCAPGHFCPPGSTSPTEYRCGDVYLFLVDVLAAIPAQAGIQANPFNSSDRVPLLHPAYDYAALYDLYAHLAGGGAVGGGFAGTGESGAWRVVATEVAALPPLLGPSAGAGGNGSNATGPAVCGPNGTAANCSILSRDGEWGARLDPSQLVANATAGRAVSAGDGTVVLQVTAIGPANWTANATAGVWGSTGAGFVGAPNATTVNYTVTIPWRAGVRFRLPPVVAPLPSFAAVMRHVLVGGPAAVYCPTGTEWPIPVPLGHVSNTSAVAVAAAPGAPANHTRDAVALAPRGAFAVAGIAHPCPPGRFGATAGLAVRTCTAWCPPAHACPEGTADPIPCPDGTYASAGAAACTPCPGATAAADAAARTAAAAAAAAGGGAGGGGGGGGGPPPPAAAGQTPTSLDDAVAAYAAQEAAYLPPDVLNEVDAADAAPRVPGGAPGTAGLPASPPLARCRDSRDCCGVV